MKIGKNIFQIREAQKLSGSYVADKLNTSVAEYEAIENDEIDITLSQLERIAEILSSTPVDIIQYDDATSSGIKNYFYNHNGSSGTNIHVQGIDQTEIRKSYKELYVEELNRIPKLEKLLKDNNIEFTY